ITKWYIVIKLYFIQLRNEIVGRHVYPHRYNRGISVGQRPFVGILVVLLPILEVPGYPKYIAPVSIGRLEIFVDPLAMCLRCDFNPLRFPLRDIDIQADSFWKPLIEYSFGNP